MTTRTLWQDLYGIELHRAASDLATHTAADPTFVGSSSKIGIQGAADGKKARFAMPLTDHPNFKSPSTSVDTRQARGIATRHEEEFNTIQTGEPVEFTLPFLAHAYNIATFLPLLFQDAATNEADAVASGDQGQNVLACIPYTTADVTLFGYFTRHMQPYAAGAAGDIDLVTKGSVAFSITFSGEAGSVLTMEAVIRAAAWEQKDLSSLVNLLSSSFDIEQALKYQDATIAFLDAYTNTHVYSDLTFVGTTGTITSVAGDFSTDISLSSGDYVMIKGSGENNDGIFLTGAGTTGNTIVMASSEFIFDEVAGNQITVAKVEWVDVKAPSISFTLTNNVVFNFYNDDVAVSAHLGDLTVEGTIVIPYSQTTVGVDQASGGDNYMISRFLAGSPILIAWYWGQSGAAAGIMDDYQLNPAAADMDRYKNDGSATNPKNFFSLVVNARVVDYEQAGDNEQQTECTLLGVTDSVSYAVAAYARYDSSKLDRVD